ncbi:hypothetical protein NDU88_008787 [Pleurodeles waltl]|uniref:Uncharacterized protein n=1 Tax=Pleurodeles waltl TaxID=8319 RepID=A0AAV7PT75_PLEWA|nr:hypothetical protein NDU88_008787 [Pleurodeles waltl]
MGASIESTQSTVALCYARSHGLDYSLAWEGREVGVASWVGRVWPGIGGPDPPTHIGTPGAQLRLPQAPWRLAADGEWIRGDFPPPLHPDRLTALKSEWPLSPNCRRMSFATGRVESPMH